MCFLFAILSRLPWQVLYISHQREEIKGRMDYLFDSTEIISLLLCPTETAEVNMSPMWPKASRAHTIGTQRAPGSHNACFPSVTVLLFGGLRLGEGPKWGRKLHLASTFFFLFGFFETLSLHSSGCPRTHYVDHYLLFVFITGHRTSL